MATSEGSTTTVAPLRRRTGNGTALRRPAAVEREIAAAIALEPKRLRRRAARAAGRDGALSNECLVHLVRRDVRLGARERLDVAAPELLRRAAASLQRAVRGFAGAARDEVVQEILDGLVDRLIATGDDADFFEVRFALALKRLRIDVCRKRRRELGARLDGAEGEARLETAPGPWRTPARDPEQAASTRQLLERLPPRERTVWLMRQAMGYRINAGRDGDATIVARLRLSERTVRNRLRSAEARLAALAMPREAAP